MNDQPARRRTAVLAGLTTAAVVVPQSMAYASLAGLPVQVGLYTAFVPMLVYAALGTSRPLSVSTTSTIAALTSAAVISAQPASAADAIVVASTLALLCGAVLCLAGLCHLGFLGDFISLPVLTGYKAGVGLVIIAAQLGKLLGVTVEGEHVGAQVWSALSQLGDADGTTVAMSVACIAALVVLKRFAPPAVPGPLIVVAVAIAVTALADLAADGLAVVGSVPGGLPRPQAPDLALLEQLLPSAAGIALMAFVESNAAGRSFTPPGEHEPDADRELLALGAANVGGSVFQAMPSGGGLSQTAVNYGAGARTKLAGFVTALTVMTVLLFLTGLFEELPEATLGALLVVSAVGLVDVRTIGRLRSTRTIEGALAMVTLVGVATLGVLDGVLIGVLASILSIAYATNHPPIVGVVRDAGTGVWVDSPEPPQPGANGVLVVRIVASLFFANAPRVRARLLEIAATTRPRVLVIDLSTTPVVDVTALAVMEGLAADLENIGVALRVAGPHEGTRALIASVSADPAWRDRTFPTITAAVED